MVVEFPMVEEDAATGRVAAVYAAAGERAPFIPSLFKSLAVCPPYLTLAWEQAVAILEAPALTAAAAELAARVERAATPPSDPGDRELLAGFVDPLGKMLLLSCGLLAALDGRLGPRPSAACAMPSPPDRRLEKSVPSTQDLSAEAAVLGRIRTALGTPIVNSIWRKAAGEGRLHHLWDDLEPQAARTRADADRLREAATTACVDLPWKAVADRGALETAGIADAEPGMRVILDAYATTLPRVLTLVASSAAT